MAQGFPTNSKNYKQNMKVYYFISNILDKPTIYELQVCFYNLMRQ